ncbi:hypothetical protein KC361_g231 [Hortaea werneckii]|nr:hypothetical protein KC361_g231 [Hortaea werneckii]
MQPGLHSLASLFVQLPALSRCIASRTVARETVIALQSILSSIPSESMYGEAVEAGIEIALCIRYTRMI